MTPEDTKAAAAVMLAYAEGKSIEYRSEGFPLWDDTKQPSWVSHRIEYASIVEMQNAGLSHGEGGKKS